jgi:hypothetical protein
VLAPLLLGAFVSPVFGGDEERAEALLWGAPGVPAQKAGAPAPVLSLDELAERARRAEPRLLPESYRVLFPGRDNGEVQVQGPIRGSTPQAYGAVRLRLKDGAVLYVDSPATETASGATWRWIRGLHYAYFGGLPLRILFFVLALATCATILTGNWVWLARREARRTSIGNRVLARLTAGVGAGTFVAVAALFLASRLLPLDLAGRGAIEELVFVGALVACIAWALASRKHHRLWWQQLGLAGVLLLLVPLLAARWSLAGLFGAGPRSAMVTGVDIAMLVTAFALSGVAFTLRRAATGRATTSDSTATQAGDVAQRTGVVARSAGLDA